MRAPKFVLPAAGIGSRLAPSIYPKELLPIAYSFDGETAAPRLVIQHSLDAMKMAGLKSGVIVISPTKQEILRHLGDGSQLGFSLLYSVQPRPTGLPQALNTVAPWLATDLVCMALPDTIFEPTNAVTQVLARLVETSADLALGVFPTEQPERLGPVTIGPAGRILRVEDKPERPTTYNTWGVAAWNSRFTNLLQDVVREHESAKSAKTELTLGSIFDLAICQGFSAQSVFFPKGVFLDLGTPQGLYRAMRLDGKGALGANEHHPPVGAR